MTKPGSHIARHQQLVQEIREHDRHYYEEAAPTISDAAYDRLYRELVELEEAHPELISPTSPTQRVGGRPLSGFKTVAHLEPMLSLDNIFAKDGREAVEKWIAGVQKLLPGEELAWYVEPKVDGVAVSLRYENGVLTVGATRGDGRQGDDITQNLRTIRRLPLELTPATKGGAVPGFVEVRGEAYMTLKAFEKFQQEREAEGETIMNPRNATAGSLKQLDPAVVAQRPISIVLYGLGAVEAVDAPQRQRDLFPWLQALGLPVPPWGRLAHDAEGVMAAIGELEQLRHDFGFETDGAVVKLDSFAQREQAGFTARAPRWAKAYKFAPEQAETTVRDITVQVGRTGNLTPVAELEPTVLRGSTISRATLHNEDEIRRKDIRIGDTVIIEKAGEVIPAVVEVVAAKRTEGLQPFDFFTHVGGRCPACGGPIARDPQYAVWRCENLLCPAQKTRRLEYMAHRKALDLEGLGGIVADKLVERGLVEDPLDLWELAKEPQRLAELNLGTEEEPRVFGAKNAEKLVAAIGRARTMPLARWLHALAIPEVGETTAFDLGSAHGSLAEVAASPLLQDILAIEGLREEVEQTKPTRRGYAKLPVEEQEQLAARHAVALADLAQREARLEMAGLGKRTKKKDGAGFALKVGPVTAQAVLGYFASAAGQGVLARLAQMGISPKGGLGGAGDHPAAGKTFVITGTLHQISRQEATERLRAVGANVSGSVSKKTHYLVVGENAGSKLDEARAYGVQELTEAQLLELLGDGGDSAASPPVETQLGLL